MFIISCNEQKDNNTQNTFSFDAGYDAIKRNKMIKNANAKLLVGNNLEFFKISANLQKEALLHSDTSGILYARMNLGYYYSEIYQIDSAYFYFTAAEKLSKKTKSKELLENLLQYKADILWSQKNYIEAQCY